MLLKEMSAAICSIRAHVAAAIATGIRVNTQKQKRQKQKRFHPYLTFFSPHVNGAAAARRRQLIRARAPLEIDKRGQVLQLGNTYQ